MNSAEAIKLVEAEYAESVAKTLGCEKAYIPDELTDVHDWGWVFWMIPFESDEEELHTVKIAFHKVTGKFVNIGPRGIQRALDLINQ